jgi:hypothetical protein
MGLDHSPIIVTDGLVLYFDGANRRSYSGSGNTTFDLSGFGNTGTLFNGIGFSSANQGTFFFDGTNDYILVNGNTANRPSEMTIMCNLYARNTRPEEIVITQNEGNGYRFMTKVYSGNTGVNWGFRPAGNAEAPEYQGSTLVINNWYNLAITYTASSLKLYKNSVLELNQSNPYTLTHGGNIFIGYGIGGAQKYLDGNLSNIFIYNRALTSQEIVQNYNATKKRYGL